MEKDDDGDGNEEEEQMNTVLLLFPHKDTVRFYLIQKSN